MSDLGEELQEQEGPFLSLTKYIRAQEIHGLLQRKSRNDFRSLSSHKRSLPMSTFQRTGHTELRRDFNTRLKNTVSVRPHSVAKVTGEPTQQSVFVNKMVQTFPQTCPEDSG